MSVERLKNMKRQVLALLNMARSLERELEREIGEVNRGTVIEEARPTGIVASERVIGALNRLTGRQFDPMGDNTLYLIGRLLDLGYGVDDLLTVVGGMCRKWLTDEKMAFYLRPETLFSPEHFESYLQFEKSEERREKIVSEISSIEDMARRAIWKSEE